MTNNLTAVQGFSGDAGATVWWVLKGGVAIGDLRHAWLAQGLPEQWLPEVASVEKRLSRAVGAVTELRKLARPIERRGHWGIVDEVVQGDGDTATLRHDVVLKVRVSKGVLDFDNPWHPIAGEVAAAFARQEGLLHRDDLALWLADVVKLVYGTPMKPRGGIYYVLPQEVDRWRKVCRAIETADAGTCYTLPTLQGEEATRAVLDALVYDVESEAEGYAQTFESVGARALKARVRDCDALLTRLSQYEGLLGGALDKLRAKVTTVQDAAMLAAYAAEAAAMAEEAAK
jgi:hypothetical protein